MLTQPKVSRGDQKPRNCDLALFTVNTSQRVELARRDSGNSDSCSVYNVGHKRGASLGLQGNLSTSFLHFGTHAILNKGYLSTHVLFLHIFGRRHSAIVYF